MENTKARNNVDLSTNAEGSCSDDFDRFVTWIKYQARKLFSFIWDNRDWFADQYRNERNDRRAYQCTREALQRQLEFETRKGDFFLKVSGACGNGNPTPQRPANLPNGQTKKLSPPRNGKKS